jgi:hypothetical protein
MKAELSISDGLIRNCAPGQDTTVNGHVEKKVGLGLSQEREDTSWSFM